MTNEATDAGRSRVRLLMIVESGTDVRTVEAFARRFDLSIVARRIPGGVEISRVPEVAVPIDVLPPSRVGFAARVFLELLRRRRDYDCVQVQGYGPAALACNLARLFTGKSTWMHILTNPEGYYRLRKEHGGTEKPYREIEYRLLLLFARLNALLGDRCTAMGEYLRDLVLSHGARFRVDVSAFYGVDTSRFRPGDEPRDAIRARRGIPVGVPVVFYSSRVAPEKDAETMLAALRILRERGRDVRLLHRSGGWEEFLRAAEREGVADAVVATDAVHPVKELPDDFRACDVTVQASRDEGLGLVPLESMACGTPAIASAVGGLVENVIDGETGWTFPVGDAKALADRVEEVLDDPAEAKRRTENGRRMVAEKFEAEKLFDELRDLIEESVRSRARR